MVVFALRVMPDLENHGADAPPAPTNSAKLLRIVVLLVNQVRLVKDFLRLLQADAMFLLDGPALRFVKFETQRGI